MKKKTYRSFKDARKFARKLGLKNKKEWREYCKSGNKPDDIPATVEISYKFDGWKGMGDWLGTNIVAKQLIEYRSFKDARKFVRSLKLKNYNEWREYYKSEKRPKDIPTNPFEIYKTNFCGIADWLGNGKKRRIREFKTFDECKKFVHKLKLESLTDWQEYCKSGKLDNIPTHPERKFKDEWKGWGDWLGTGKIPVTYLPWKEAKPIYRRLAKEYGLTNDSDWRKFAKSHRKLLYDLKIPVTPSQIYTKERVWRKMKNQ